VNGTGACLALSPGLLRAAVATGGLNFPRDHGSHPDSRVEWWYLTGLLDKPGAPGVASLGVQLTFFRLRTAIPPAGGRYSPDQLLAAHAAIADPTRGLLLHDQRIQRISPPLVKTALTDTKIRLDHWNFERDSADGSYRASILADSFDLSLVARPTQTLLLQGEAGWSRKGPGPDSASWYYSAPQLALEAQIKQGGSTVTLRGTGWLDHEWSDAILDLRAAGWDWIGMNLDNGAALTAFQIRPRAPGPAIWSYASLRDSGGKIAIFGRDEVNFSPLADWRSPRTGAIYPVAQRIRIGERTFETRPLMNDQELDSRASTGAVYWEGASTLLERGQRVGRGYLEMTGYLAPLRL
jgi:predicted secreted hydrolase